MALNDLIISDVTDVFFDSDEFAEQVSRYSGGDQGNIQTMTAVVTLFAPQKSETRGIGYVHRGDLMIADDTTLAARDAVKVRGLRYEVEAVSDSQHGTKTAKIVRYEPEAKGVRKAGDL